MSKKAVLILAEGFETLEALTPVDILRRAKVELVVASLGKSPVISGQNVAVQADCALTELLRAPDFLPDALILPGGLGGANNIAASREVEALAKRVLAGGKLLAAICATPGIALAKFGVLSGRTATCYPGHESGFPADAKFVEDRVCVDGNLLTSRGPGTALEFSIKLAELLCGEDAARQIREGTLFAGCRG